MYYRIFDIETKDYSHSAYNCRSKKELRNILFDFLYSEELDKREILGDMKDYEVTLQYMCDVHGYIIESQKTKFENYETN